MRKLIVILLIAGTFPITGFSKEKLNKEECLYLLNAALIAKVNDARENDVNSKEILEDEQATSYAASVIFKEQECEERFFSRVGPMLEKATETVRKK